MIVYVTEEQAREALTILREEGLWAYDSGMANYFVRCCLEVHTYSGFEFRLFIAMGVKFRIRWDYRRQGPQMYVDCYSEEQRLAGLQEKIKKANLRLDVLTAPVTE